ncbi:hypothetical protein XENTR_v10018771 [Xenopus tropicalis]|uniref:Uncharacterized protein LOC116412083 n=1 Tax=Xenopus tropicalis TaxID=8364 RepID=A0A8J1JU50_XENTR|nr:uncharacterized protein LOC116412083 [Xenopus tropicalis]KAE8592484.1 hypothetical protein XENTR_v10018771 [Xenopus tropicalis]
MGPKRPFVFMMLMVIALLLTCQPASAVKHITLFRHKLTFTAHTWNLIPCMFYSDNAVDPATLQLEWGKVPVGGGKYTPLIHLNSDGVRTFHENSEKYQLFVSLVPSGNCTLAINPTETTDSGTYEFFMLVNGERYEPASLIKIEVLDENKTSSQSRAFWSKKGKKEGTTTKATPNTKTTATTSTVVFTTRRQTSWSKKGKKEETATTSTAVMNSANSSDSTKRAAVITVMVMGPLLVITSIISGVGIYLYWKLKRKLSSVDIENPQVKTLEAQSQSASSLQVENETLSGAEEETEEEEENEEEETTEEET